MSKSCREREKSTSCCKRSESSRSRSGAVKRAQSAAEKSASQPPSADSPVTYGYVRVSTNQQKTERQIISLRAQGIVDRNIYTDHASGKNFERAGFKKLMKKLKAGDTLVIASLDRLGRSFEQLPVRWFEICFSRGVNIRVLDNPLLNSGTARTTVELLIHTLIFVVYSYMAEEERIKSKERQEQGIAAARARGVQFGRPPRKLPDVFEKVLSRYYAKEITGMVAAKLSGLPLSTFYKIARRRKAAKNSEQKL